MTHKDIQLTRSADTAFDLALAYGAVISEGRSKAGPNGEKITTYSVTMSGDDFKLLADVLGKPVPAIDPIPAKVPAPGLGQGLHPAFQEIVDRFLSPIPATGYHTYEWDGGLTVPVVCELEYEEAERGSREQGSGLQMEPDYPESMTLVSAEVNGVDIYPLLDEKQKEEIEIKALKGEHDA
jgi:hypothetical protein